VTIRNHYMNTCTLHKIVTLKSTSESSYRVVAYL